MQGDLGEGEKEDGRWCWAVEIVHMNDDKDLNLSNHRVNEEEGLDLRENAALEITHVGDQLNVEHMGKWELWKGWLEWKMVPLIEIEDKGWGAWLKER